MLDIMLAASDHPAVPDAKKLSDTEVIAQSFVFLAARYETSSATLSLTCYHIATHPDVQDKLQQEIDSVWSDEDQMPTYETVNELQYLDMVISETLRLYPPGQWIRLVYFVWCVYLGAGMFIWAIGDAWPKRGTFFCNIAVIIVYHIG